MVLTGGEGKSTTGPVCTGLGKEARKIKKINCRPIDASVRVCVLELFGDLAIDQSSFSGSHETGIRQQN